MKALMFTKYAKQGNLVFADVPRPMIEPEEILVQVHAGALNPIDYMIPKGMLAVDPIK